jgi:hypothetical protein
VYTYCVDVKIDLKGNCVALGASESAVTTIGDWSFTNPSLPLPPPFNGRRERRLKEDRRMQGRGRALGAFRGKYEGYGNHAKPDGFTRPVQGEVQVADVTLYPSVGYVAVLDGSTGDVLQAGALAGLNAVTVPYALELYKGFAYIAGATGYDGDGTKYTINGFPQVAYGQADMLLARVHLKTMDWKYVRTIGGEGFDYLSKSTMELVCGRRRRFPFH